MNDLEKVLREQIERDLWTALLGPPVKQRQTALRIRNGVFESVEIDDAGNIIEPPRPCPYCRVVLCSRHVSLLT